jgi:mannose-6-phosphate isomerase-like protein (cupin superfamily)
MNSPVSRSNRPHYVWGEVCDGWRLADDAALSVIEEKVPPGGSERRHFHRQARQFFYILEGEACIEVEAFEHVLRRGQGLEVPPAARHLFLNRSAADVVFLVISSPSTKEDRVDV